MYPYTAKRRDVFGNTSPEDREISEGQGFCTPRPKTKGCKIPARRGNLKVRGGCISQCIPSQGSVQPVFHHESIPRDVAENTSYNLSLIGGFISQFIPPLRNAKCMDTRTIPRMSFQVIGPLLTSIVTTLTGSELLSTTSGWEIGRIPLDVQKMKV